MFIVIDGIDGSGKTTAIEAMAARLAEHGIDALVTSEFGSALPWGPRLRKQLVAAAGDTESQYQTVLEARKLHSDHVLLPALMAGRAVLMDRYIMSTIAYQGQDLRPSPRKIIDDHQAAGFADADFTVVLDCSPAVARQRLAARGNPDKIDSSPDAFLAQAAESFRCSGHVGQRQQPAPAAAVINAHRSADDVAAAAWHAVSQRFGLPWSANQLITSEEERNGKGQD